MCRPERPQADEYDSNEQVQAHFSTTPGLTPLPQHYRYYGVGRRVKREIGELYSKYSFERCERYGLFWAGDPSVTKFEDRVKTLLLVVELKEDDIKEWWNMDDEVRQILRKHDLSGRHQVCVRYYQHWDELDAEEASEVSQPERQSNTERTQQPSQTRAARHDSVTTSERDQTVRVPVLWPWAAGSVPRGELAFDLDEVDASEGDAEEPDWATVMSVFTSNMEERHRISTALRRSQSRGETVATRPRSLRPWYWPFRNRSRRPGPTTSRNSAPSIEATSPDADVSENTASSRREAVVADALEEPGQDGNA